MNPRKPPMLCEPPNESESVAEELEGSLVKKQGLEGCRDQGVRGFGSDDSSSAVALPVCGNVVWLRNMAVDKRWESMASYWPFSSHCGGLEGEPREVNSRPMSETLLQKAK